MGEILNFSNTFEEPRDAVNDDGDIVSVDDYFSIEERALYEGLHEQEAGLEELTLPHEYIELLADADALENQLRSYGAHDNEIRQKVGTFYAKGIVRMQMRNIDLSGRPKQWYEYDDPTPEDDIEKAEVIMLPSVDEVHKDREVQRYMDSTGQSYYTANLWYEKRHR